jgi:drug/metabolite transporter (DMT)-like permease
VTSTTPRPPTAGSDDTGARFGPPEWGLTAAMALVWGSSFLLIAIAIDHVATPVVPFARVVFGALALLCVPAARVRLPRSEWPRLVFLGLVWMAIPFLLFPMAEETTSSAVAGMVNGALPVFTVVVTAVFVRKVPTPFRVAAVLVGFSGIALISYGSVGRSGGADVRGITLLVLAVLCYAVAVNVATPMQRRYGSLPVILHVQLAAVLWTAPAGLEGLSDSTFTVDAVLALLTLGAVGTGLAFALYGLLLARTGPVRGMIGVFFTPVVATVLGVVFRSEPLSAISVVGMVVVIVGAVMTSRPDRVPTVAPPPMS